MNDLLDFKSCEVKTTGNLYGGRGTATGAGTYDLADGSTLTYSADTRDGDTLTMHTETDKSTGAPPIAPLPPRGTF